MNRVAGACSLHGDEPITAALDPDRGDRSGEGGDVHPLAVLGPGEVEGFVGCGQHKGVGCADEIVFAHVRRAHVWRGESQAVSGFPGEGEPPGVLFDDVAVGLLVGEIESEQAKCSTGLAIGMGITNPGVAFVHDLGERVAHVGTFAPEFASYRAKPAAAPKFAEVFVGGIVSHGTVTIF